jgi:hypothetical protein
MNVRRPAHAVLAASAALLLAGCTGFWSVAETDGTLEDSMRTYTKLVRWGELERASEFVDETIRPEFVALQPHMERLRVTDFEMGPVDFAADGAARVTVVYHAYDVQTLVERRIVEAQEWTEAGRRLWKVRPDLSGFQAALGAGPPG